MSNEIKDEIKKLRETIIKLDKRNQKVSTIMLILTFIGTAAVAFPFFEPILASIDLPAFDKLPLVSLIAGAASSSVAFIVSLVARRFLEGDAVKPIFYNIFREKPRISAVHQYEKSDSDVSGYKHLGQNSRKDQRERLIEIQESLFGMRYKIKPLNKNDILTVIISRNGRERNKVITFNKESF